MSTTGNKQAILYVITNLINGLKYYGMVHKKDKTIEQRFNDHKQGMGGRFLYKAMQEFGVDNFIIEKVERGDLDYIRQREVEETANTLYVHGRGYNGNCGKCIILDEEMRKRRITNTDQAIRVKKWKDTYIKNKSNHDYSRNEEFLKKLEENNYSKIRGKTKHESERLQKLSISNKQRWDNPTEKMLIGKQKSIQTNKNKSLEEKQEILKKQLETKKQKRLQGLYKISPCIWNTPLGNFKTAKEGADTFNIGVSTFKTWCIKNKQILKRHHKHNENIKPEWDGKHTHELGFSMIRERKQHLIAQKTYEQQTL